MIKMSEVVFRASQHMQAMAEMGLLDGRDSQAILDAAAEAVREHVDPQIVGQVDAFSLLVGGVITAYGHRVFD
jgi:hypothetical protein